MTKPINLNKARKARAKTEKTQRTAENRIKFGRTKPEKVADTEVSRTASRRLDGKFLKD